MTQTDIAIGLCVAVFSAAVIAQVGYSAERKGVITRPPVSKKMTVKPLTVDECKDLGGEVRNAAGVCLSGKACQTVGEDGKKHGVCISAK